MLHPISEYQETMQPFGHCPQAVDFIASCESLKVAWFSCPLSGWLWWIVDDMTTYGGMAKHHLNTVIELRKKYGDNDGTLRLIRKEVPYLAVIRAWNRYTREYDVKYPETQRS